MTLATLLSAQLAYREERSNWPWICLLIFPFMTLITATWFFVVVATLCAGALIVCLLGSKRPESWRVVLYGAALALAFIWPSVNSLISGSYPVYMQWTPPSQFTPFWEFIIQWWPALVPWILLCFVWFRMNWMARWIHAAALLLLIFVEVTTVNSGRVLPVEKIWGAVYGLSMVTFIPLVLVEAFRFGGGHGGSRLSSMMGAARTVVFFARRGYLPFHRHDPVCGLVDPQHRHRRERVGVQRVPSQGGQRASIRSAEKAHCPGAGKAARRDGAQQMRLVLQ